MAIRKFILQVGSPYPNTERTETVEIDENDFSTETEIENYLFDQLEHMKNEYCDCDFEEI